MKNNEYEAICRKLINKKKEQRVPSVKKLLQRLNDGEIQIIYSSTGGTDSIMKRLQVLLMLSIKKRRNKKMRDQILYLKEKKKATYSVMILTGKEPLEN